MKGRIIIVNLIIIVGFVFNISGAARSSVVLVIVLRDTVDGPGSGSEWGSSDYSPSPGFPGSDVPYVLPEADITSPKTSPSTPDWSGGYPTYWNNPFPAPSAGGGGKGVWISDTASWERPDPFGHDLDTPCEGDPVKHPSIAPTKMSGFLGGTYGYTRSKGTQFHDGIDIKADINTRLYAMYSGTVTAIDRRFSSGQKASHSYGNYITIKSTINGVIVFIKYGHLNTVSNNIDIGTQVNQGLEIGLTGNTGNAADDDIVPHVHIQAKDENGKSIDPEPYLGTTFDHITWIGTKPCQRFQ